MDPLMHQDSGPVALGIDDTSDPLVQEMKENLPPALLNRFRLPRSEAFCRQYQETRYWVSDGDVQMSFRDCKRLLESVEQRNKDIIMQLNQLAHETSVAGVFDLEGCADKKHVTLTAPSFLPNTQDASDVRTESVQLPWYPALDRKDLPIADASALWSSMAAAFPLPAPARDPSPLPSDRAPDPTPTDP
eukprot:TRINITY_DN33785_c0_g1_i1.p1 TRINITY_DN33785_c0_g1~~TRINITY_DN33785_c0_g1_i1.p1  ORF type:complete len:189 (-),score=12.17 TRINITY_DN33785_c0_g1_i1:368-934(-)